MIRCEEARQAIAGELAGEPDHSGGVELDRHLQSCAACARDAAALGRALGSLDQDEPPDPGPAYWAAFGARVRARIAARHRRSRLRRIFYLAAAAAVVTGVALVTLRQGEIRSPDQGAPSVPGVAAHEAPEAAEAHLDEVLQRIARAEGGRRALGAILDDMLLVDPLEFDEALGTLSPEESAALGRELTGQEG